MRFIYQLSVARKLLLLGVLLLVTLCVPLGLQLKMSRDLIDAAEAERRGVEPSRQLVRIVQLTQHHRGLSAAMLGGNSKVAAARDAKRAEVDAALASLDDRFRSERLPTQLAEVWKGAQESWRSLQMAVEARNLSASESSTRHAQAISQYLKALDLLLD